MGVSIEGIDLTGLVHDDFFSSGILSESQVSNDGSLILYERLVKYTPINLVGGDTWGVLTLLIMRSLQELSKVLEATYTLNYEGVESTVRFRTEDPPALYGEKIQVRSDQQSTDYYNNIFIKLMEV